MCDKLVASLIVFPAASVFVASLTCVALPPIPDATTPASLAKVFQVAGTAGILVYCFAHIPNATLLGSYKRTILANAVDGLIYGAITGANFA